MNQRLRGVLFGVAGFAVFVLVTQVVFPGIPGGGRGTPGANLFAGFVRGLTLGLVAAGLILVYRSVRVINFAQTAMGAVGARFFFEVLRWTPVPFPLAFLLGLVVSAVVALLVDLIFGRRFFNSPRLVLTVVTIAVAGFLTGIAVEIRRLPFFPDFNLATTAEKNLPSLDELRTQLPFRGWDFRVGDSRIQFGFSHVFAIEVVLVLVILLAAFLRYTRVGVAVRALAENPERASLLGISIGALSSIVWVTAGVLGGAAVMLFGMVEAPGQAAGFAPEVLLPALAAAVLARMRSLPVAMMAAVGIGVMQAAAEHSYPDDDSLIKVALLGVIIVGLLLQRRAGQRADLGTDTTWQAVEEVRPVPKELAGIRSVRLARYALIALVVGFVVIYPWTVSTLNISRGSVIIIYGIATLSLVVLTGWAGQVSLGQFALVGVGSVVGGALTARAGVAFWFAVPMTAVVTAVVATIIGLPALRIRGLFLAVTTFALALAVHEALFDERYFGWLLPKSVEAPTLFFLDFRDVRSMYYLCVVALIISVVVVVNLRRGRFGRILIASRENEPNLQSFGVGLVRTKLMAFCVAGAIAGFAGAIFAHQQQGVSADSFEAEASITLFVFAVLGGIGSPAGALVGSTYGRFILYATDIGWLRALLLQFGVLGLLFVAPGGLLSIFMRMRDSVLRIIAQRRQLVVPSLFADVDPDALERRLIPLAEAAGSGGLGALPARQRYRLASELYPGDGRHELEPGSDQPTKEAAALTAAAESAGS